MFFHAFYLCQKNWSTYPSRDGFITACVVEEPDVPAGGVGLALRVQVQALQPRLRLLVASVGLAHLAAGELGRRLGLVQEVSDLRTPDVGRRVLAFLGAFRDCFRGTQFF